MPFIPTRTSRRTFWQQLLGLCAGVYRLVTCQPPVPSKPPAPKILTPAGTTIGYWISMANTGWLFFGNPETHDPSCVPVARVTGVDFMATRKSATPHMSVIGKIHRLLSPHSNYGPPGLPGPPGEPRPGEDYYLLLHHDRTLYRILPNVRLHYATAASVAGTQAHSVEFSSVGQAAFYVSHPADRMGGPQGESFLNC